MIEATGRAPPIGCASVHRLVASLLLAARPITRDEARRARKPVAIKLKGN